MTIEDLRAKWRAASGAGKVPRNATEVWKTHEHGIDGTVRRVAHGSDWLETSQLGQFATSSGDSGGTYWHENFNGEVILSRQESAETSNYASVAETLTRVTSPVDAYVIESVSADGAIRRVYYSPSTFLIVRRETDARGTQSYAVYDDFVTDASGRTYARHVRGGDQLPNDDWDRRLISVDLATPVREADVAIPATHRTLVEFPEGRTTVRLPARFVRGAIVVRVQIGERGLDFILDTGAESIVIDPGIASQLGLRVSGLNSALIGGRVDWSLTRIPEMKIGDLRMHDVAADVLPFAEKPANDVKAAGLLGFDFLDAATVTIDYAKATVDATSPGAFVADPAATLIPARFGSEVPEVSLSIGAARGDHFVLDTGAQDLNIILFQHFVRQNQSHVSDSAKRGEGDPLLTGMIGGVVQNSRVLMRDLAFGPWFIDSASGYIARSPAAFDGTDGLLGSDFLQNFRITLDEPHSRLYMTPLALSGGPPSPTPAPRPH